MHSIKASTAESSKYKGNHLNKNKIVQGECKDVMTLIPEQIKDPGVYFWPEGQTVIYCENEVKRKRFTFAILANLKPALLKTKKTKNEIISWTKLISSL